MTTKTDAAIPKRKKYWLAEEIKLAKAGIKKTPKWIRRLFYA